MLKQGTIVAQKYRIEHLIAEGGMAELYLASMVNSSSNYVALKRLLPKFRNKNNYEEYFIRESQYIININCSYIVKGQELLRENSEIYLVMEFILGSELGHINYIIKKENSDTKTKIALAVALSVGRALKYIKQEFLDLVHGDISPQNILITGEGEIKLVDFGIAVKARSPMQESDLLRGTMRYMSPEQRQGQSLTQASDIYSLGLVLEEILGQQNCDSLLYPVIKKAKAQLDKRYQEADDFLIDIEKICLAMDFFEPQNFMRQVLREQPRGQSGCKILVYIAEFLSFGGALAIIVALVVTGGTRFFYPRIPDVGIDDQHCEDYSQVLENSADY